MTETEGPSFLTSAPVAPPEPDGRGKLVVPETSPFRTPGEPGKPPERPSPPRRITQEERPIAHASPEPEAGIPIGDAAGEHLTMTRGRYSAWTYVVIAFLLESALLGALPMIVLAHFLHDIGTGIGFVIGAISAWRVFHDRWRCIEAFSSRFCSGLMNLSILYVPFVAFIYANARAFAKLHR